MDLQKYTMVTSPVRLVGGTNGRDLVEMRPNWTRSAGPGWSRDLVGWIHKMEPHRAIQGRVDGDGSKKWNHTGPYRVVWDGTKKWNHSNQGPGWIDLTLDGSKKWNHSIQRPGWMG